ncbi:tyrosine-type recombinase/integrase [Paraburkholderia fungorum]|uniref:tyrosine-type recombinase/integrase n=1 Tax=Paraburkholderia fungorum TaxID=134537 RepID=UPI0038BB8BBA
MTALPPGLRPDPKSGIYHLRIGIPKEIRRLFPRTKGGKPATDAFRESLGTANRAEAITIAHRLIAEHRAKFQALEDNTRPAPFVPLTAALEASIARAIENLHLDLDEQSRTDPKMVGVLRGDLSKGNPAVWAQVGDFLTKEQVADVQHYDFGQLQAWKAAAAQGDFSHARELAEFVCAPWSIRVNWDTPDGRSALQRLTRATVKVHTALYQRSLGEPVDTPDAPMNPDIVSATEEPIQEPDDKPKTLRDMVPSWQQWNGHAETDNPVKRAGKALKLFEEACGPVPLSDLTRATGAAFAKFLLDGTTRGFGAKTAHNHYTAVNALVNTAVKDGILDRNLFAVSFDKTKGAKKREGWTDSELAILFGSPLFSNQMEQVRHWDNVTPEDGRAALLLLLHTGARIGEIAQLRREDFQTRNGVKTVRITAEAGTVKTDDSERVVALASHLLEDPWFSAWHKRVAGGTGGAFPSLSGRATPPGGTLGKWFRELRRSLGLPLGQLDGSHKFRHWIRGALADKGIGTETADSITGHAAQGSSGRVNYTKAASPRTMREALDSLEWPEITAKTSTLGLG